MPKIDPDTIAPGYNPFSGVELAQIAAAAVYNKLSGDSRLNPGITYKLFQLSIKFEFELNWQNELGEPPNQLKLDGATRVEVDPNVAPDDVRKKWGLEVPK